MPVTIQPTTLKYKNGNTFVSVDCLKGDDCSDLFGPDYSELTFPVAAGQHCIHEGNYYAANQAIATAESWTSEHWDQVTVGEEVATLKTGKADKVSGATNNNFAALDSNGNLKDSGHKHSDYLTSHQDISGKTNLTEIAPAYADLIFPVSKGQGCIYQGVRYAAKQDINTSETWTAAHWESEKIEGALSSVKNDLRSKADVIINTKSGSIVTLTDAIADEPLTGCVVTIDEDQTGFAGCNISRTGKNLLKIPQGSGTMGSDNGISITTSEGNIEITGSSVSYGIYDIDLPITIPKGTVVKLSGTVSGSNISYRLRNKTSGDYTGIAFNDEKALSFDVDRVQVASNPNIQYSYTASDIQLEYIADASSPATTYEPYTGNTYPVTFPVTVTDGGSFDAVTGVLTVNTDPVTTYNLDPVTIKTLLSNPNNIWADTGDISVSYKADTKAYVDQNEGVKDVKVGGTTVVDENGVANVPVAGSSTLGVVKTSASYGLSVDSNGRISTSPASSADIKNPDSNYKTVGINRQHESVFYGLAKAANADMASLSSVTVGQYPDAQKVAIQKMLGIYQSPWELIREDTVTNATEADIEITVDGDGNAFELTDIRLVFWTPLQEVEASKGEYGRVRFYYGTSAYDQITSAAWTQATSATNPKVAYMFIDQKDGMIVKRVSTPANKGSNASLNVYSTDLTSNENTALLLPSEKRTYTKVNIRKVTGTMQYRLYGKRKWN